MEKFNCSGANVPEWQSHSNLQWNSSDKIDQYRCVEQIFQSSFDLERKRYVAERGKKQQQLNELRQAVKEMKLKLISLKNRERDAFEMLLKGYQPSNRLKNNHNSLDGLLDCCDHKLLNKRKESDRLIYEMNQLSNAHAAKLKLLNKMQKYQKCGKSHRMKVEKLTVLSDNSETQIQNYEIIVSDCKRAIDYLSAESLHYASTLKSLENEIKEQNAILNAINSLSPVMDKNLSHSLTKRVLNKSREPPATNDVNVEIHRQKQNIEKPRLLNANSDNAKLAADAKNVDIRKINSEKQRGNRDESNHETGKKDTGKDDLIEITNRDTGRESERVFQAAQTGATEFERISGDLLKFRDIMQRFKEIFRRNQSAYKM